MVFPTYASQRGLLLAGEQTCVEVVRQFLHRIREREEANIYLEVFEAEVLDRARSLDQKRVEGKEPLGALFGMVVSLKDLICYAGHRISAGSRMLEGYVSPYSATAVDRLIAADALIIGRVNCDEFAMGSANEFSAFGPTQNPAFPGRVPGGSSGGSAAAVAGGTCHVSLGSDTGGSVRQPAAFCGVQGLKPTYGRISRHGLIAYGSSLDQIGLLGHTAEDLASVLAVIAGADKEDATSSRQPVPDYRVALAQDDRLRIGIWKPEADHAAGLAPAILENLEHSADQLAAWGHQLEPVQLPWMDVLVPCYYVLATAEASSNLSRYDGVRYGYRGSNEKELRKMYRSTRTEGFGPEVKRRILLGAFVLSSGYYDAYYGKAQDVRRRIRYSLEERFRHLDLLLMPTTPTPPWKLGEHRDDPTEAYLADVFTVLANLAGFPAVSLPAGTDDRGLPIGMQIMAAPWQEGKLFQLMREWEQKQGHPGQG